MKCSYLLLMVLCSAVSCKTAAVLTNSVEDHYWRDWRGLIPSDAIPAGTNHDGETTYIGQISVHFDGTSNDEYRNANWNGMDYLPAVVTHGNDTTIAPYHGKTISSNRNSNVKVLCSGSTRRYQWHTEPSLVGSGCRYLVVGQEGLSPLYVGRAVVDKQTLFGKVFSDRNPKPLIVPYKGGELVLENYATLTYCN